MFSLQKIAQCIHGKNYNKKGKSWKYGQPPGGKVFSRFVEHRTPAHLIHRQTQAQEGQGGFSQNGRPDPECTQYHNRSSCIG